MIRSGQSAPTCRVADCDRIDRLEGAILRVSVEISQVSDTAGSGGVANLFLFLVESGKWGVNSSCTLIAYPFLKDL